MNGAFVMAQSVHTKSRHVGVFSTLRLGETYVKQAQATKVIQNMKGLPGQTN